MRREAELDLVDTVGAGMHQLPRRQLQWRGIPRLRRDRAHRDPELGVGHGQPGQLTGHRLGQRAGRLRPHLGQLGRRGHQLGGRVVDGLFQPGQRLLGDIQLRQPIAGFGGPRQHTVDIGGVLAGQGAQLGLTRQLGLQRAGVTGQIGQERADLAGDVTDHRQRSAELCAQCTQRLVVGALERRDGLTDRGDRRSGELRAVGVIGSTGQCGTRRHGGFP